MTRNYLFISFFMFDSTSEFANFWGLVYVGVWGRIRMSCDREKWRNAGKIEG